MNHFFSCKNGYLPEEEGLLVVLAYYQLQMATHMYLASHFWPNSNHIAFSLLASTESNTIPSRYQKKHTTSNLHEME